MHFLHAGACPSPSKHPEHGQYVGVWDARLCRAGKRLLNKHPQQDETLMKLCEPTGDMGRRTCVVDPALLTRPCCSSSAGAMSDQGPERSAADVSSWTQLLCPTSLSLVLESDRAPGAQQEFPFMWSGVMLALPSWLVSGFVIYWINK